MESMELFSPRRKKGPQEDRNRKAVAESKSKDELVERTVGRTVERTRTVEAADPEGGIIIDSERRSSGILATPDDSVVVAPMNEPPHNDGEAAALADDTEYKATEETQQGDSMDTESRLTATTTSPDAPNKEEHHKGKAKTETVVPSSLSDQDMAVYGNLNARLADIFTERIEAAISKGVDSLPLLDGDDCYRRKSLSSLSEEEENVPTDKTKSPKQRLWDALRYRFVRNVDILEAYCAHHVLTLRKHPPARRKRIVAVMMDGIKALPTLPSKVDDDEKNKEKGTGGEVEAKTGKLYPTRTEIPSEEETKDLAEELSRLQAQLESAKQKRNALLASVESANRAEQAVSDVIATIEANLPTSLEQDAIRSNVSGKVEKGNTVSLLAEEAKTLVGKLDGIKRNRSNNSQNKDGGENNIDGFDFVQRDDPLHKASHRIGNNKRQKSLLSLEEAYRKDRRELGLLRDSTNNNENESESDVGSGSSGPTLSVFRSMLMAPPSSSSSSPPQPQPPRTPTN
jgi:hypothetical protein